MSNTKGNQTHEVGGKSAKAPYETPAIIYEGLITTRAGSPISGREDEAVDPADIFGEDE